MSALCPWSSEEGITSPGTGVADGCVLSYGFWDSNLGPVEEQPVLLSLLSPLSTRIRRAVLTVPLSFFLKAPICPSGIYHQAVGTFRGRFQLCYCFPLQEVMRTECYMLVIIYYLSCIQTCTVLTCLNIENSKLCQT